MEIVKPDVIIARPVSHSEQASSSEQVSPKQASSVTEIVDTIMNQSEAETKEMFQRVVSEVTDSIFKASPSSLLQEEEPQAQTEPQPQEETEPQSIPLNPENDRRFIERMIHFLAGREFEEQCKSVGAKHNLPPKIVAKNFCLRILGTIGDILGITINVTRNFVKGTIELLVSILFGGIDLMCDVAQGLVTIFTLNQTAQVKLK